MDEVTVLVFNVQRFLDNPNPLLDAGYAWMYSDTGFKLWRDGVSIYEETNQFLPRNLSRTDSANLMELNRRHVISLAAMDAIQEGRVG